MEGGTRRHWSDADCGGVGDGSYHGNLVKALNMALKYHDRDMRQKQKDMLKECKTELEREKRARD